MRTLPTRTASPTARRPPDEHRRRDHTTRSSSPWPGCWWGSPLAYGLWQTLVKASRPLHRLTQRLSSSPSRGRTPHAASRSSYSRPAAVSTSLSRGGSPGSRPHGAQQRVAGRVGALDELHDVDPVALAAQQRGPQGVGEGVGEPLAQDAVAGQHGVGPGRLGGAQLRGDVVVAAGRGEHQRRVPLQCAGQCVVGRGVAGVQRQDHVGRPGRAARPRWSRPRSRRRCPGPSRPGRCGRPTAA